MSNMPEPWKSAAERVGLDSYRKIAAAAGLSTGTIHRAFTGARKAVQPETISGIAQALRISEEKVSDWLGMGRQTIDAYSPPQESAMLTRRERKAIDELIRLLVATRNTNNNPTHQQTVKHPFDPAAQTYIDVAEAKLRATLAEDFEPAAHPPIPEDDEDYLE